MELEAGVVASPTSNNDTGVKKPDIVDQLDSIVPTASSSSTSTPTSTTPTTPTTPKGVVVKTKDEKEDQAKTTSNGATSEPKRNYHRALMIILLIIALLLCVAAIVGVVLGLNASDRRNENKAAFNEEEFQVPTLSPIIDSPQPTFGPTTSPTSAPVYVDPTQSPATPSPTIDRKQAVMDYIIEQGVSIQSDLEIAGSPQNLALEFISNLDSRQMRVPTTGTGSFYGYKFITRYVMAVFYFAMEGANWNYDLYFLSELETCDWYKVYAPPMGQVGVLCDQATKEIVGLSLSKYFSF